MLDMWPSFPQRILILLVLLKAAVFVQAYKKPNFCEQETNPFSFLWMVKREPPAYLFGTIHVPYTRVWDHVPENAKQAFEACSLVFFELDLMDPETVSAMSTCQMLPQGKNLSDVLPKDLYDRLKRHLEYVKDMMPRWMTEDQKGKGMYADYLFKAIAGNWERKRPVWVMLMVNYLTESDVRSRGVPVLDLYLAQEAIRLRKKTGAVERVEEQCLPLNGLNLPQVLFALNHTLQQHEELRESDMHASYTTDDLIRHYNCGDLDTVIFSQDTTQVPNLINTSLTEEDAAVARDIDLYFQQELIFKRNTRMGMRVAELIEKNPQQSLFFAFGAGHFLGNNTVIDYLESQGFEIEHIPVGSKLQKKPKLGLRSGALVKTLLRASGEINNEKRASKDDNKWKSNPSSRKPSRKRIQSSSVTMNTRTDTSARGIEYSTPRPRLFNDLWVRLDDYHRQTSHLHKQDVDLASPVARTLSHRQSHRSSGQTTSPVSILALLSLLITTTNLLQWFRHLTCDFGSVFSGIT